VLPRIFGGLRAARTCPARRDGGELIGFRALREPGCYEWPYPEVSLPEAGYVKYCSGNHANRE